MMNNSNKNTPKGGQAKTTFVFDPANLTISDLYITQSYGGEGFTTSRIFSNRKMQARLLLNYSYEIDDVTFGDETEAEIMAIVKAGVEAHFRDDDNLIICQAFHTRTDITETGWQKAYEPNGYLIDLDNDGRHIDFPVAYRSGYMETMSETSGKSQPLYNPMEALAEPRGEIVIEEDSTLVNLVFTVYVTPPAGTKTNYTLWARYRYENGGEVHTQDSSEVSLQTETFNVTEDTVQLTCIARNYYTEENEDCCSFSVLYALCYRGDNYGAAKPYNVKTYRGLVIGSTCNLCLSRVKSHYTTGIFYYPGNRNPYDLYACGNGTYSEVSVHDITARELDGTNTDTDELTTITAISDDSHYWSDIYDFTEDQASKAHSTGIPVTVRMTGYDDIFNLEDEDGYEFEFQIDRPYLMEDNCGNTFELTIKWPDYHGGDDIYGSKDFDPHDVDTTEDDPRTFLYHPDFENMYKLKVWPTYPEA